MKIFASNYLESWSDGVDGNDWSWEPVSGYKMITGTRGRPTKTMTEGGCPSHPAPVPDSDFPQESMGGGLQVA